MRLHRTALAGIALGALLPVSAAEAATGVSPAGRATSTATLASIKVGALLDAVEATNIAIGTFVAGAETMSSKAPSVTFVPLTVNGVKNGAVTVTPANSPKTVGGISSGDLGVLAATSPTATLKAADGSARTSSLTSDLGSLEILGLPITMTGGVNVGSVTDGAHAQAGKTLTIKNVSLPNVADIIAALGIDMAKLPAGTLNALIDDLRVTISATAQQALDAANNAIATAEQAYDDGRQEASDATADLAAKTASFAAALSGASVPDVVTLPEGADAPLSISEWAMLTSEVQSAIEAANDGLAAVADAYDVAKAAQAKEAGEVAALQQAIDDAVKALSSLVEGVLGGLPLVSVGAADIGTKALVGKTKSADITGSITGVKVLGNDILSDVTGNSTADVAAVAGDLAQDVNAALNTATAALSNALSSATGATGLVVPAPKIELMQKDTSVGVDGAYGTATAALSALSISLGSVTVPTGLALADAAALPGIGAITGGFKSAPIAMKVGVLGESARFRPGTATTTPAKPVTPGQQGSHPATGGPEGLAIVAVIGAALAVGVRRFRASAE
ncbi:MAG TPA: hypothetical protein VNA20_11995 [Frankiaceae bacterium]|nr:hypothetical protein [Frankiaceae bacterium]